jgi:hypothetical protein
VRLFGEREWSEFFGVRRRFDRVWSAVFGVRRRRERE